MAGDAAQARSQGSFLQRVIVARYAAPRWLPGGHLQTIYAAVYAPRPRVSYRRERWQTPDGDFVDADFVPEDVIASAPARGDRVAHDVPFVVLFHGLEGSSRSHYSRALMAHVAARGFRGAVIHFRGCSGEPNRLPRAYHSGDTAELDWMVRKLRSMHPDAPLYIVGVSLGGNVLLKWLGERGREASELISAAAAVCAPVDVTACGNALDRGFNLIYTRAFLASLKAKSLAKLEQHPRIFNADQVRRAGTLRAFDNAVTAPLHGFRDTDDYWARASSKPHLGSIAAPTLILNSLNDPFLPPEALPSRTDVPSAVTLDFPAGGGHVGFVEGPFPGNLDWLPRRLFHFFRID